MAAPDQDGIFIVETKQRKRKANPDLSQPYDDQYEDVSVQQVYQKVKEVQYYLIMDKFGDSLRHVHESMDCSFSFKTTAQIGIQLVNILQTIHDYGYVFNDLKPDNILIGDIPL